MIDLEQMQTELKKYLKLIKNPHGNVDAEYAQTQRVQNESFNNCLFIGNERQLSRNSTHQNIHIGKYNNKIKRPSQDFQNVQYTQVKNKSNPNIKSQTQKSINSNKVVSLVSTTEQYHHLDKKPRSISQQTTSDLSIKAPYINSSIQSDQNLNPFITTRTQKTISLHNEFGNTYHIPTSLTSRNEYHQENVQQFSNQQNFPFQRSTKPKSFTSSKTNILSQTNITSRTNIESQRDISQQMNSTYQKVNASKQTNPSKIISPKVITQSQDQLQENQQGFQTQRSGNFNKIPSIPKFGHHLPFKKEKNQKYSPNQNPRNLINNKSQSQQTQNIYGKNKVNNTYSKDISKDNSHILQGSLVIDKQQKSKENSIQHQNKAQLESSNRNSLIVNNSQQVNTFSFDWKNKTQPLTQYLKSNLQSQQNINMNLNDNRYTSFGMAAQDQLERKFSINSSLQQEKIKNSEESGRANSLKEKMQQINIENLKKLRNFGDITIDTVNQKKTKEFDARSESSFSIFSPPLLDIFSPSEGQRLNRIETIYLHSEQSKVSIPRKTSNDILEISDKIKEDNSNLKTGSALQNDSEKQNFIDQNFNLETIESANYNPPKKNKQPFQNIHLQQVQQSYSQQGENKILKQFDNLTINKNLLENRSSFQTNLQMNEKMFTFESPHKVISDDHHSRFFSTDGKVVFYDGKSPCQNTPTKIQGQTGQKNIPSLPDLQKNNFDCFSITYQTDKKQNDQQNSQQRSSREYQSPFENKFSQQPPDGGVSPIIPKNRFLMQDNSDNKNNVIGQAYSYNGSEIKQENSQQKDIFESGQNSFLFGDPIQDSMRDFQKSNSKYNDYQIQDPTFKDLKTLENNISFKVISNTNQSMSNSSQAIQSNRQSEHIFNLYDYEKFSKENNKIVIPVPQENISKTNENNPIKNSVFQIKINDILEKDQPILKIQQQSQNNKSIEQNDLLFNISEKLQKLHSPRQEQLLQSTLTSNTPSQKLINSNGFCDYGTINSYRDQYFQNSTNSFYKLIDANSTYSSLKNPVISTSNYLGVKTDFSSVPIAKKSFSSHQDMISQDALKNRDQNNQISGMQQTSIYNEPQSQSILSNITYNQEQTQSQNQQSGSQYDSSYTQLQNLQYSSIKGYPNTQSNPQIESIIQPYLNGTYSSLGSKIQSNLTNNYHTDWKSLNEKIEQTNKKHIYDFEMNQKINSLKPLLFTSMQSPPIPPLEPSPIYYSSQFNYDYLNSNQQNNLTQQKSSFEKPQFLTTSNPITSLTQVSPMESPSNEKNIQKYKFPAFKFDIQEILDRYIPKSTSQLQKQSSPNSNPPQIKSEYNTVQTQINDDFLDQLKRNSHKENDQYKNINNPNNTSNLSIYNNNLVSKEQDSIKKDQNHLKFYSFQDNDSSASSLNLTTLNNNKQIFSPNYYQNQERIKEESIKYDINKQDINKQESMKQNQHKQSSSNADIYFNNLLYRDQLNVSSLQNNYKNDFTKKQYSISTHEASNQSNPKFFNHGSFSELPSDSDQLKYTKSNIPTVLSSRQSHRENQEIDKYNNISLSNLPSIKSSFCYSQQDNYKSGIVLTPKTFLNLPHLKYLFSKFTCEQVLEQLFDNFSISFSSLTKDYFIYKIQCLINQYGTHQESLNLINKELEALYDSSDMNKDYYLDINELCESLMQLCKPSDYDYPIKSLYKKFDTQNQGRLRLNEFQNFAYNFGYDQIQFSKQNKHLKKKLQNIIQLARQRKKE